jgi:hypothetical protein
MIIYLSKESIPRQYLMDFLENLGDYDHDPRSARCSVECFSYVFVDSFAGEFAAVHFFLDFAQEQNALVSRWMRGK